MSRPSLEPEPLPLPRGVDADPGSLAELEAFRDAEAERDRWRGDTRRIERLDRSGPTRVPLRRPKRLRDHLRALEAHEPVTPTPPGDPDPNFSHRQGDDE